MSGDPGELRKTILEDCETYESHKYCHRDTCPTCRNAKLEYDKGQEQSFHEPQQKAACYCPNCGDAFEVDHERQTLRDLASKIADELFTNGCGQKGNRLVMVSDDHSDLGGWCKSAAEDRIFAILIK